MLNFLQDLKTIVFCIQCYQTFTFSCTSSIISLRGCQVSFVHLLVINKNIRILTMGRDVTKSVERVVTHVFFHFVSQEELIASKVILLPHAKLIVRVS